uniref:Variant surface glycoprotein 1114 n=1 Tax=Trypanosoma brucei TaxID=5691 RepID=M4SVJ4_9TRYP|nr:variant surface glycoprotein 1114 [Trypanosoma brucei]APD73373.1 variant surface glycoprotein 1125.1111 [Trypanosoma brucei]
MLSREDNAALVLLMMLTANRVQAGGDDTEAAHRAMCALTEAASATFTTPPWTAQADELNDKIQAANMSVADTHWQALFDSEAGSKPYDETTGDNRTLANKLGGKEKWDGWRKAFANIKALGVGTKPEGEYPKINSKVDRKISRQQLRPIAAQANKLEIAMKPLKAFLSDGKINKINENLRKALYGGGEELTAPTLGTSFGGDGSSWANLCGTKANRKSIAGDFFCMCTGANAAKKQCSAAYEHTTHANQDNINTGWAALRHSCSKREQAAASANTIYAAIAQWRTTLKQKASGSDNSVWLGASSNSGAQCAGTDGNTCIDYSDFFKTNSDSDLSTLPWLKALTDAEQQLKQAEQAAAAVKSLQAQMQALQGASVEIYSAAASGILAKEMKIAIPTAPPTQQELQPQTQKKQEELTEKECNAAKDEDECKTKTGCIYDKANKKCTLSDEAKQAVEKANQETEEMMAKQQHKHHKRQFVCD